MTTVEEKAPSSLTGSQDLLAYFDLIPIYNKVVKPYPPPDRAAGLDHSLFPYLSDLPGKLDLENDGYLINLLRDPQAVESGPKIKPLDAETLRDAFTLKEGPVPGFDSSFLGDDGSGGQSTTPNNQYMMGQADVDHNGERRHKKKKKKRRHDHDHDEEGHSHSDHKKKKKKKKDKERRDDRYPSESLIVD